MFHIKSENEGPDDLYAVVAEWSNQGPILVETEGPHSSLEVAQDRLEHITRQKGFLRGAIVSLKYETGNALVLHDMKRMQK